MANPHLGEVPLTVGDETYKISFSLNAMCELEDAFGRPLLAVISELEKAQKNPTTLEVKTLRLLVWGALQDHHPDIDLKAAGILAGRAGMAAIMGKLMEAIALAFPVATGEGKANPRKAKG